MDADKREPCLSGRGEAAGMPVLRLSRLYPATVPAAGVGSLREVMGPLLRVPAYEADLQFYLGQGWREKIPLSPSIHVRPILPAGGLVRPPADAAPAPSRQRSGWRTNKPRPVRCAVPAGVRGAPAGDCGGSAAAAAGARLHAAHGGAERRAHREAHGSQVHGAAGGQGWVAGGLHHVLGVCRAGGWVARGSQALLCCARVACNALCHAVPVPAQAPPSLTLGAAWS